MSRSNIILFLVVAIGTVICACSTKNTIKSPTAEELIAFPPPPDTARIQFLTYINSSADIVKPPSGLRKFFIGAEEPKPIVRPYGIKAHKNKIYICDPGIGGLEIIDLNKRSFEYFLPTGIGQLRQPFNCFVDEQHNLYVADGGRRQVVVYDSTGKYLNAFGEAENFKPIDLCIQNDEIYIANIEGDCYNVYNRSNYKLTHTLPTVTKEEKGYLHMPNSILCTEKELYICDFAEGKINVYDINGNFQRSIGKYGTGIGQFTRPKGIELDKDSNLYVVDAAFENVQIFNKKGQLLTFFGQHGNMNLPAGISISYENLDFFQPYVYKEFELKFLIYVTNQFPPNSIGVYGFVGKKVNY